MTIRRRGDRGPLPSPTISETSTGVALTPKGATCRNSRTNRAKQRMRTSRRRSAPSMASAILKPLGRQTTRKTTGTTEIAHRRGPQKPPGMVSAQWVATKGAPPTPPAVRGHEGQWASILSTAKGCCLQHRQLVTPRSSRTRSPKAPAGSPANPRMVGVGRPCPCRESPPIPGQPHKRQTGLSRRSRGFESRRSVPLSCRRG